MPDFGASPGQTIGPFFHYALPYPGDRELVPLGAENSIRLRGHVFDGAGVGVPDALIEIRQAHPSGIVPEVEGSLRRGGSSFTGWGRSSTDPTGLYWFCTLRPAPTRDRAAAFFAVTVFARGLLDRLFTRIYLPGQDAACARDPLLKTLLPEDAAKMVAHQEDIETLHFDIHLQGPQESIFLAFPGYR